MQPGSFFLSEKNNAWQETLSCQYFAKGLDGTYLLAATKWLGFC